MRCDLLPGGLDLREYEWLSRNVRAGDAGLRAGRLLEDGQLYRQALEERILADIVEFADQVVVIVEKLQDVVERFAATAMTN
jgi:hypothetical protein